MPTLEEYLEQNAARFEQDLCELLRIPSVSTDGAHLGEMDRAAGWLAEKFRGLGFAAEIVKTAGCPIVYAESPKIPGARTVLVYGHYDVQPPEPLAEWLSPPFEPTIREGILYARGATDDKGQVLTHLQSAQAWLKTAGRLPLNLKYVIEGEEEIGSEHLRPFIEENIERLACDCVVISDTSQFGPGQPAITYGLKGIAYYELRLTGPKQDLHSGVFGGAVTNPATAVARMLAALVDDRGKVQVPGFYDDVVPISDRERRQFASLGFSEEEFREQIGVDATSGEEGFSTLERRWARPTYDVNGLFGGYQGEGAKTVLPSRAGAKFSFRLVPNQDPDRISVALKEMLTQICPPGIKMELVDFHGSPGLLISLDSPFMGAAARAIERGFGRAPVFIREGGSIPVVTTFHEKLGADTLLLGWGQNDDNAHAPNEKFRLADYHAGIKSSAYLWEELSRV
ncbi:MAG: dipeptidase [Pirellulales bacterium]